MSLIARRDSATGSHSAPPLKKAGGVFTYHGIWAPGVRLFRQLSFAAKSAIIVVAMVLPLLVLLGWQLVARHDEATQARIGATRQLVEVAHTLLVSHHAQEASGALTRAQAQEQALREIAQLRYDGVEYFWVNDMHPRMVMHPTNPALNGQDLTNYKDPHGFALFNAMVDVVRKDGQGTVSYQWPRPGGDVPVDKVSFVKSFEPWGWVIGSGVYADDIRAAAMRRLMWNGGIVAISLLLLAYLFLSFYRVMQGGLLETRRHLRAMKDGDLTTTPAPWGKDEPAELMLELASMQTSLRDMVARVRGASDNILYSTGEINRAAVDLAARTQDSASNIQQTAAAMEQIRATVYNTSENTIEGAQVVDKSAKAAGESAQVMREMAVRMKEIRASSSKISDIINTIDAIAFQTNILSLNAAVEAARTGEHGRGFAVVASEVRSLAHHSANAASEIKKLITESVQQIEAGAKTASEAGAAIEDVLTSSQRANDLLSEIANGAREQSVGVDEIGKAVQHLDGMTQDNAAMVQQTVSATDAMRELAERLANEVARFRLPEPTQANAGVHRRQTFDVIEV
ncbi:MAG: cache domain-containing protein [Alcaligenaceae bacterium]|nr:cache domain-containing protein [Alcaligenaceae bacterium]